MPRRDQLAAARDFEGLSGSCRTRGSQVYGISAEGELDVAVELEVVVSIGHGLGLWVYPALQMSVVGLSRPW